MQDIEDQDIPNLIGGRIAGANIFQGIPSRCFGSPVPAHQFRFGLRMLGDQLFESRFADHVHNQMLALCKVQRKQFARCPSIPAGAQGHPEQAIALLDVRSRISAVEHRDLLAQG